MLGRLTDGRSEPVPISARLMANSRFCSVDGQRDTGRNVVTIGEGRPLENATPGDLPSSSTGSAASVRRRLRRRQSDGQAFDVLDIDSEDELTNVIFGQERQEGDDQGQEGGDAVLGSDGYSDPLFGSLAKPNRDDPYADPSFDELFQSNPSDGAGGDASEERGGERTGSGPVSGPAGGGESGPEGVHEYPSLINLVDFRVPGG